MRFRIARQKMTSLLTGDRCVIAASVFDPISARIAANLGYETALMAGSSASMAVLGAPDEGVLSLAELADQAKRVCRAVDVPLIVDADNGYGNALNVMRTVEEMELAGVCTVSLEDTPLPAFGTASGDGLLSIDESVKKYRAALAARRDPDMAIIARTPSLALAGMDECLKRLRAYEDAGVDGFYISGIRDREDLEIVSAAIKRPILMGARKPEFADLAYLASQKVRVNHAGNLSIAASIQAMHDTLRAVLEGVAPGNINGLASEALIEAVTRQADYSQWSEDYLK